MVSARAIRGAASPNCLGAPAPSRLCVRPDPCFAVHDLPQLMLQRFADALGALVSAFTLRPRTLGLMGTWTF
jgi:hypothetical protein